ncbi:MAG: glycosyltransferase family 4 protein [Planctomycetota bacterium]
MRALYASFQIPSPRAANGGGQAAFEYLETLSRFLAVDVITSVPPGREDWLAPLAKLAARTIAVPWAPSYAVRLARWARAPLAGGELRPLLNRPFLAALHAELARERYDLVQVDWTEIAQWVRAPAGTRFACGAHDVREKLAARRWRQAANPLARALARAAWERARREESALFARADLVLTLSDSDAARVRELAPGTPVFSVVYKRADTTAPPVPFAARDPRTLLYVGDFSRRPNRRVVAILLREVLPRIRARHPAVRLVLAGGGASPAFRRRAEAEGAEVTGYLSRLDEVYRRATIFVAPIPVGGGLHVKFVEAMATGLAVVTSPVGNDGLAAPPGRAILLAATPAEMAAHAIQLLEHPAEAEAIGRAGAGHVRQRYGAERARELLARALEALGLSGAGPP